MVRKKEKPRSKVIRIFGMEMEVGYWIGFWTGILLAIIGIIFMSFGSPPAVELIGGVITIIGVMVSAANCILGASKEGLLKARDSIVLAIELEGRKNRRLLEQIRDALRKK